MSLLLGCGDGSDAPQDELQTELEQRFDHAAADGFSGVALVIVAGQTRLARGYGFADRGDKAANVIGTAFDVGSVMKELTAAAIFKLEGEGALATSDTLADIFENVPADKAAITLLQLVRHTAGLRPYHDTEGDFEPMTRTEARSRILAQELLFEPGRDEQYSNSGYTLLADVIETVTGRAFTAYVCDALFAPAGMQHSGFYGDPVWDQVDTAIGYEAKTFGDNDPRSWPLTWALVGNGGLVATAPDLERWLVAVRDGSVLSTSAFEAYEAEYLEPSAFDFDGKTVYAFSGAGDYGLGGVVIDSPQIDSRFIVATNTFESFDIERLASKLGLLIFTEH